MVLITPAVSLAEAGVEVAATLATTSRAQQMAIEVEVVAEVEAEMACLTGSIRKMSDKNFPTKITTIREAVVAVVGLTNLTEITIARASPKM